MATPMAHQPEVATILWTSTKMLRPSKAWVAKTTTTLSPLTNHPSSQTPTTWSVPWCSRRSIHRIQASRTRITLAWIPTTQLCRTFSHLVTRPRSVWVVVVYQYHHTTRATWPSSSTTICWCILTCKIKTTKSKLKNKSWTKPGKIDMMNFRCWNTIIIRKDLTPKQICSHRLSSNLAILRLIWKMIGKMTISRMSRICGWHQTPKSSKNVKTYIRIMMFRHKGRGSIICRIYRMNGKGRRFIVAWKPNNSNKNPPQPSNPTSSTWWRSSMSKTTWRRRSISGWRICSSWWLISTKNLTKINTKSQRLIQTNSKRKRPKLPISCIRLRWASNRNARISMILRRGRLMHILKRSEPGNCNLRSRWKTGCRISWAARFKVSSFSMIKSKPK